MSSSTEYVDVLNKRADEYELIIAAFERMNAELLATKGSASPQVREFCERHIELNLRTLGEMHQALKHANNEVDTASPFSG
jgi:hypothetical protein